MKKFYTIASTLMLSMSMALMTSCSSDNDLVNDKPVLPEQGARTVTLKATADMSAESRVAVEGVEGKEDAFRITGWKNGDEVKVLALKEDCSEEKEITFTYNASTETFTGTVPSLFELSELKYAYVGGNVEHAMFDPDTKEWDLIDISTPIAISNPEDCFLFGNVNVDGEAISANLSAPYALACVHNNTSADIEVGQITNRNDYFKEGLLYAYDESTASSFTFISDFTSSVGDAKKFTVPAGQKAYFVIPPMDEYGNYYGLYDFTHSTVIAAPKNITLGKVYKVQVYPFGTGRAKATIGGSEVDVNWVQLWAGGPKFAEYNVGVTDGKAESYGGYYCWGSSIDKDTEGAYNTGTVDLTGDNDTATNLWGNAWRMPTSGELDALLTNTNCTCEWTTQNGVNGLLCTGTGSYSSNSIFLPAAGLCYNGIVDEQGNCGYYRSSTPYDSNGACSLYFNSGLQNVSGDFRFYGYSVRAVLK